MIQLAVIPLVLAVSYLTIRLVERSTPPADRIRTYRPDTVELPAIEPLPEWLHEAGPAVWSAGRTTPNHRLPAIGVFPDPPHPIFVRQPHRTLTATVAAAWDHWEARHPRPPAVIADVYEIRPGAPIHIGPAVCHHAQQIAAVA